MFVSPSGRHGWAISVIDLFQFTQTQLVRLVGFFYADMVERSMATVCKTVKEKSFIVGSNPTIGSKSWCGRMRKPQDSKSCYEISIISTNSRLSNSWRRVLLLQSRSGRFESFESYKYDCMDINEIKKDSYRSKAMAKLNYYCHGNLYYHVEILGSTYQFPIATTEIVTKTVDEFEFKTMELSTDLGTTAFSNEIRGSELIRWIKMAMDAGVLIQLHGDTFGRPIFVK